ncbi:DUF5610 domain-containing protein [Methylomonas sp. LL1]|uniref:DUF5610 domain-containing protein n=1 Tax=Methylomonas sp. LL1 TaxID=2785785 RepID=UPI0018C35A5F|nr:DUF5610 domain-containing protein [Methylomonas sp. LL1]QPK63226.1 DUF5610 domain-containing protein [Methylomonas sp. LL1]
MLEEDDSSTINARLPDPQVYTVVSSARSNEALSENSAVSTLAKTKSQQNAAIVQASLDVSIQSKNEPLALLLKTAITGINELLKSEFGVDAIQAAASQDNTPTGTAGRILSLSTGFFEAFKRNHSDENPNDVLTKFMDTIRSGFEKGAKEAQGILKSLGVLGGDIASNIDKTLELVRQGYIDFEDAQRSSLLRTSNGSPADPQAKPVSTQIQ